MEPALFRLEMVVSSREHSLVAPKTKPSIDVSRSRNWATGSFVSYDYAFEHVLLPVQISHCKALYLPPLDIEPFCRQVQEFHRFHPIKAAFPMTTLNFTSSKAAFTSVVVVVVQLRGANAESIEAVTTIEAPTRRVLELRTCRFLPSTRNALGRH